MNMKEIICPVCLKATNKLYDLHDGGEARCRSCCLEEISERNNGIGYVCACCRHFKFVLNEEIGDGKEVCQLTDTTIEEDVYLHTCPCWEWDEGKNI